MPGYIASQLPASEYRTVSKKLLIDILHILREFDNHLQIQHSDDGSPMRIDIVKNYNELSLFLEKY